MTLRKANKVFVGFFVVAALLFLFSGLCYFQTICTAELSENNGLISAINIAGIIALQFSIFPRMATFIYNASIQIGYNRNLYRAWLWLTIDERRQ
jgi:hypothetical protein